MYILKLNVLVEDHNIPPHEVRFIQEAKNDKQRKELIKGMNEGKKLRVPVQQVCSRHWRKTEKSRCRTPFGYTVATERPVPKWTWLSEKAMKLKHFAGQNNKSTSNYLCRRKNHWTAISSTCIQQTAFYRPA